MAQKRIKLVYKTIGELFPDPKNPRRNDAAVPSVMESIRMFGFKVPIIADANGNIVAGHTRYKAAKELGLTKVPVVVADELTEKQLKAFQLADNKTGEFAKWDSAMLNIELESIASIFDLSSFGFDMEAEKKQKQKEREKKESEFVKCPRCGCQIRKNDKVHADELFEDFIGEDEE